MWNLETSGKLTLINVTMESRYGIVKWWLTEFFNIVSLQCGVQKLSFIICNFFEIVSMAIKQLQNTFSTFRAVELVYKTLMIMTSLRRVTWTGLLFSKIIKDYLYGSCKVI